MKTCTKCELTKEITDFRFNKKYKDNYLNICKKCEYKKSLLHRKTKVGIVGVIYQAQVLHSKTRGHNPPQYNVHELRAWINNQEIFHELYDNWVDSNYERNLKPSVDRLDDFLGYSLDNIQIITWEENNRKTKQTINYKKVGEKVAKKVVQMDMDGNFIKLHRSIKIASTECNAPCVDEVINPTSRKKSSGGYRWKYA